MPKIQIQIIIYIPQKSKLVRPQPKIANTDKDSLKKAKKIKQCRSPFPSHSHTVKNSTQAQGDRGTW